MTACPNPTRERVWLKFDEISSGDIHIEISSTEGKRFIERDYWLRSGAGSLDVDVSQLPLGVYVVIARHKDLQEYSRLVIE